MEPAAEEKREEPQPEEAKMEISFYLFINILLIQQKFSRFKI